MDFCGTISLGVEMMIAVLSDVTASVLDDGFDAVLFLNSREGNKPIVGTAASKIGEKFPDTPILGVTYFDLAAPFVDEIRDSDCDGMAHGGEFETSLVLHLRPDFVRMERADAEHLDKPYARATGDMFDAGPLSVYRSFREYSESGAVGDPLLASAEKGEELYDDTPISPIRNEVGSTERPFDRIGPVADEYDFGVTAWTVCLHNSRLEAKYPDFQIESAFGDSHMHSFCPSHGVVRAYFVDVVRDLASRGIGEIQRESIGFPGVFHGHRFGHAKRHVLTTETEEVLLSQCCCDGC